MLPPLLHGRLHVGLVLVGHIASGVVVAHQHEALEGADIAQRRAAADGGAGRPHQLREMPRLEGETCIETPEVSTQSPAKL